MFNSGRCQGSKVSMPLGGQTPPNSASRGRSECIADRALGEQRRIEEGPEPGDEEHHFGGDEQDHAVAVADLHHAGVVALVLGLADHVRPPARHGVEHADGADAENDRRGGEHVMHPGDRADRHDEGRDGADDRPRAGIDEVVVVVLDLRRSHCGLSVSVPCHSARIRLKNQIPESSRIPAIKGCPCACPARSPPAASAPDPARDRKYRTA